MGGDRESMADYRKSQYAIHAMALGDGTVRGASSLFDTALTNGLLVIVHQQWPGDSECKGWTRSASQLIDFIMAQDCVSPNSSWNLCACEPLPFMPDSGGTVTVNLALLREALTHTQALRHGRTTSSSEVASDAVAALRALDHHPALRVLSDHELDQYETAVATAIAAEYERAIDYMNLIGGDEIENRANRVSDVADARLGVCPLCHFTCFMVSEELYWGSQIGTCFACSYVVTQDEAEVGELAAEIGYQCSRDD